MIIEKHKDNIARAELQSFKVVKNILVAVGEKLRNIFHAILKMIFIQHSLQITGNSFVERRANAEVRTAAHKVNPVFKSIWLICNAPPAVNDLNQRIVAVFKYRRTVRINFRLRQV